MDGNMIELKRTGVNHSDDCCMYCKNCERELNNLTYKCKKEGLILLDIEGTICDKFCDCE